MKLIIQDMVNHGTFPEIKNRNCTRGKRHAQLVRQATLSTSPRGFGISAFSPDKANAPYPGKTHPIKNGALNKPMDIFDLFPIQSQTLFSPLNSCGMLVAHNRSLEGGR